MDERRFDVLAVGEILVDFIADAGQVSLAEARHFTVFPGGEVTNVALNAARLGGSSMLVARVGGDAFGVFLKQYLQRAGVEISHLGTATHRPTTLVAITRQNQTPDFIAYRGADRYLSPNDMPVSLLPDTFCVHTSAFALAYEPARSTILQFITQAHAAGCLVSFDPNYDPRIWEQGADPLVVLAQICPYATLVKPSLDDCARLFGPGQAPEAYAVRFLEWGAQHVVLTMGARGVLLVNARQSEHYPVRPIDVVDVTGAGDSFWAGLLLATRDGFSMPDAVRFAQAVAEIKLQRAGPLFQPIDRFALYEELDLLPSQESLP